MNLSTTDEFAYDDNTVAEPDYYYYTDTGALYCNACGLAEPTQPGSTYFIYTITVIACILPLLAILGAIANLISFFVFIQRPMRRTSTNVYLAALALSDTFLVITSIFMFTFEALRDTFSLIGGLYLDGIQMLFGIGTIAQTCSVYFTVSAGVDGFMRACVKRFRGFFCRPKSALIVCLSVLLFSIIYNGSHFAEVKVVQCFDPYLNKSKREVCATSLRMNEQYNTIYYVYMYTSIMVVGPLVALIILSAAIITATMIQRRQRSRLRLARMILRPAQLQSVLTCRSTPPTIATNGQISNRNNSVEPARILITTTPPSSEQQQQPKSTRTHHDNNKTAANSAADNGDDPITLIMVVALFILCNTLSLIVNFLETFTTLGATMNYLVDWSNFMVVFNSSVNFFIYVCFDRLFVKTLQKLCRRRRLYCSPPKNPHKRISTSSLNDGRCVRQVNTKKLDAFRNCWPHLPKRHRRSHRTKTPPRRHNSASSDSIIAFQLLSLDDKDNVEQVYSNQSPKNTSNFTYSPCTEETTALNISPIIDDPPANESQYFSTIVSQTRC